MTEKQAYNIMRFWPLVFGLLALAGAWAVFGSTLEAHGDQIDDNTRCIRIIEQVVPEMQRDIMWIRETLTRMENE